VAELRVIGVRHHSPACARLVRAAIHWRQPRFVLVEGPSDMNDRLDELLLPHALPVALFSYRQDFATGLSRGMWSPFCDYSPEWVAMHAAREVGATMRFVDLPAWHPAFEGEENRYSDRHVRASDRLSEIAATLGFEDIDALWDRLFEAPSELDDLEDRLARYFAELRGDEPAGPTDGPREEFMCRHVAHALSECAEDESVLVVCGGYHKPAIERGVRDAAPGEPHLEEPRNARTGSYLVPFSFKRLDSFAGYASGMPSPAFHQAVWELGPDEAPEEMLFAAIRHLRDKAQRVSPADAIHARALAGGLSTLRGHGSLARIDVLDGLAGALVKDALDAPLPWTRRGLLQPHTDALLVEIVAAFSGERVGSLAAGTPQPPLAIEAFEALERAGIALERVEKRLSIPLDDPKGIEKSRVLHRLRILDVPGFTRVAGPRLDRHDTKLTEEWTVVRRLETDTSLVEAAIYGATLETAAASKLEEMAKYAHDVGALAETLVLAAAAGIHSLTDRWIAAIAARVRVEPSFGALGAALARLVILHRGEAVLGAAALARLGLVIAAAFDRGLWLFEGIRGAGAPFDPAEVGTVRALRDALRFASDAVTDDEPRAIAVCERRVVDRECPPALRGAALGLLWSAGGADETRAIAALGEAARPSTLGDFLGGLFVLARAEVVRAAGLLRAIDRAVSDFAESDFLIGLPALRQAFSFFPPRERLSLARALVEASGEAEMDPSAILSGVDPAVAVRGIELDRAIDRTIERFGLARKERR
jgi:hypothetical protein